MASTTRSNLVIPELMVEAVKAAWPDKLAFAEAGIVAENPRLPNGVKAGDTVKIPYFNALSDFETPAEGAALTPEALTETSETATVKRAGKAVEITTWAQLADTYDDPYAEAARQIVEGARRQFDKDLVAAAVAAAGTAPLLGKKTVGDGTAAISYDLVVDWLGAFGEDEPDALIVHPKIRDDLRKLKDANGLPIFVQPNDGGLPRIFGIPVYVRKRMPVISGTPDTYKSLAVRRGALALWYNAEPTIETDKDILADSKILAVHVYYAPHRYGRMQDSQEPGVVELHTL